MNDQKAKQLRHAIPKQATQKVRVSAGITNGKNTINVVNLEAEDSRYASTTIYSEAEWAGHPLNKVNRKRDRPDDGPFIEGSLSAPAVELPVEEAA